MPRGSRSPRPSPRTRSSSNCTADGGAVERRSRRPDPTQLVDWPFAPLAPREGGALRVRAAGADASWSTPLRVEAGLLARATGWCRSPRRRPRLRPGTLRPGYLLRATWDTGDLGIAPGRIRRARAVLDRPRRVRARAERRRRSATTCCRPAGPATGTDSATRPTTSRTRSVDGATRRRLARRRLVSRPHRLRRRALGRLRHGCRAARCSSS